MSIAERQSVSCDVSVNPCGPFKLLSAREQATLQRVSDGYNNVGIGLEMGISPRTVEAFKHSIGNIGIKWRQEINSQYPSQNRITLMALIQDGITQGYLTHEMPVIPVKPLSIRENEVIELLCEGKSRSEIAQALWISKKTLDTHTDSIRSKLQAKTDYQVVARKTYLELAGGWPKSVRRMLPQLDK